MKSTAFALLLLAAGPALAQSPGDVFSEANGAKLHVASGFVCPAKIGLFERDAVGERDPSLNTAFCAYSALDGVYGTITLVPVSGSYDPKQALALEFQEQGATGGRMLREGVAHLAGKAVYARIYETTSLEEFHYRVQFTAAAPGPWAVEVTMEFASPRDDALTQEFLNAVYAQAFAKPGQN
ncbi:MAG: hypothetical protein JOZ13_16995 [Alphaproteobacteria bacterium]|nr:hypothetical protein [Alphaproteobacteria bacterium]